MGGLGEGWDAREDGREGSGVEGPACTSRPELRRGRSGRSSELRGEAMTTWTGERRIQVVDQIAGGDPESARIS